MEHKLILGGEQYLPFARSRLKAMRAIGLVHARQTYTIESYTITVWISCGDDFIRIEGGERPLLCMDSGIVTGLVESQAEALPFAAGVLKETNSVSSYTTLFTPTDADPTWKKLEADGSDGQFAGIVTTPQNGGGRFSGLVRLDGYKARSFSPATKNTAEQGAPPVWSDVEDDSVLLNKKICAAKIPASIFTGRCRMYVQALYGLHLYPVEVKGKNIPIGTGKTLASRPTVSFAGTNAISVPSFVKATDGSATLPRITIDTSSGVYFDKLTGRHWLLCVAGASLIIYPLLCPSGIAKLRRYIKAPLNSGERIVLSDEDKEKLETFILANSLPYANEAITIRLADLAPTGETMGYGWHWNWDGTRADCVFHNQFSQGIFSGNENFGMESSHYRISLSFAGSSFEAAMSLISGPARWGVNRAYWCFAKPNEFSGGCIKLTPRYSQMQDGGAPLYAFYKKNDLNLCSVQVAFYPQGENTRSSTPGMSTLPTTYGAPVQSTTLGLLGGECLDTTGVASHYSITVDCGSSAVTNLAVGKSEGFHRWVVSSKSVSAPPVRDTTSEAFSPDGIFYFDVGYPPYSSVGPFPPGSYQGTALPEVVVYTLTETIESITTNSYVTCIVPAFDSEAIFLHGESSTRTMKSGTVQSRQGSSYSRVGYAVTGGVLSPFYTKWNSSGPIAGNGSDSLVSESPTSSDVTASFLSKELVLKDSVRNAAFDDMAEFRNANLDETTAGIPVSSGFRTDLPTVIAPGLFASVGTDESSFTRRALVGWI